MTGAHGPGGADPSDDRSDDTWDDADHYPMHPSHPGWDQRSASTERLRRVVMVLFPVLVGATGLVMAWRWWTG